MIAIKSSLVTPSLQLSRKQTQTFCCPNSILLAMFILSPPSFQTSKGQKNNRYEKGQICALGSNSETGSGYPLLTNGIDLRHTCYPSSFLRLEMRFLDCEQWRPTRASSLRGQVSGAKRAVCTYMARSPQIIDRSCVQHITAVDIQCTVLY